MHIHKKILLQALLTLACVSARGTDARPRLGIFRNESQLIVLEFEHPTTHAVVARQICRKADTVHEFPFVKFWQPVLGKDGFYETHVRTLCGGKKLFEGTIQTPPLQQGRILIGIEDNGKVKVLDLFKDTTNPHTPE